MVKFPFIKKKLIKDGYFNKVRNNKTDWGNPCTHVSDCDYVYPIYKYYLTWFELKCSCKEIENFENNN